MDASHRQTGKNDSVLVFLGVQAGTTRPVGTIAICDWAQACFVKCSSFAYNMTRDIVRVLKAASVSVNTHELHAQELLTWWKADRQHTADIVLGMLTAVICKLRARLQHIGSIPVHTTLNIARGSCTCQDIPERCHRQLGGIAELVRLEGWLCCITMHENMFMAGCI